MESEGDVDGVIGASFEVASNLGEDDAGMRVALTVEESGDVIVEEFLFEFVDGLFLFFGFVEFVEIVAFEDIDAEIDGRCHGLRECFDFAHGFVAECRFLLFEL